MRGKGATLAAGNRIDGPACDCEERTETQVGQRDTECPAPSISAPEWGKLRRTRTTPIPHLRSLGEPSSNLERSRNLTMAHTMRQPGCAASRLCIC